MAWVRPRLWITPVNRILAALGQGLNHLLGGGQGRKSGGWAQGRQAWHRGGLGLGTGSCHRRPLRAAGGGRGAASLSDIPTATTGRQRHQGQEQPKDCHR